MKVTPDGVVTQYTAGITSTAGIQDIAAGPDNALWFTECFANKIGQITTAGSVSEYSAGLTASAKPWGIAVGPDNNLWFGENARQALGTITTGGVITERSTSLDTSGNTARLATATDGSLLFTTTKNELGVIFNNNLQDPISLGIAATPQRLGNVAAFADGSLWMADAGGNLVYISGGFTNWTARSFPLALPTGWYPAFVTEGPDGNVWATLQTGSTGGGILKITP